MILLEGPLLSWNIDLFRGLRALQILVEVSRWQSRLGVCVGTRSRCRPLWDLRCGGLMCRYWERVLPSCLNFFQGMCSKVQARHRCQVFPGGRSEYRLEEVPSRAMLLVALIDRLAAESGSQPPKKTDGSRDRSAETSRRSCVEAIRDTREVECRSWHGKREADADGALLERYRLQRLIELLQWLKPR